RLFARRIEVSRGRIGSAPCVGQRLGELDLKGGRGVTHGLAELDGHSIERRRVIEREGRAGRIGRANCILGGAAHFSSTEPVRDELLWIAVLPLLERERQASMPLLALHLLEVAEDRLADAVVVGLYRVVAGHTRAPDEMRRS